MPLIEIRPGVQFRPDAAASFRRYERDLGRPADVNRTVVPYDEQMDLYELRQAGKYPYSVAHPDESNHVYRSDTDGGNAWDTDERGPLLDEHGWIAVYDDPNRKPYEPWHREYFASRDQHRNDPDPTQEDEMTLIRIKGKQGARRGGLYAVIGREAVYLGDDKGTTTGVHTVTDEGAIAALQKRISGLG